MLGYIVRRILARVPTLLIVSLIAFVVIDLPQGDYIDSYVAGFQVRAASRASPRHLLIRTSIIMQRYSLLPR